MKDIDPKYRTEKQISKAIRVLLDAEYILQQRQTLVLFSSEESGVYVIPSIIEKGKKRGQIEYMISDGLRGDRSYSSSVYTFEEAYEFFCHICKHGWTKGTRTKPNV